MGFDLSSEEIITSLSACRQLVEDRHLRPFLLLSPSAQKDFPRILDDHNETTPYDSVVIGLHPPSLSYENINLAFRILKSEPISHPHSQSTLYSTHDSPSDLRQSETPRKPVLIAPHTAMFRQVPESSDLPAGLSLGIGPFVRGLEHASGVKAEIVGKPTRQFFELAIERLKRMYPGLELNEGEIGIVGDDVVHDLGEGAKELGLGRVLVKTGKYREGMEKGEGVDVVECFADFVDDLLG
ncbi:hypothetical protein M231_01427 [Tremella mesenterica]|uniref:HAD hydrolase n=2 Tax=Tremella mesenterica TaxID=5217 RepID=A0A4V1M4R4_TREME|nr:hypothetical protein M231_01427 [Tremella mesenterica]